MFKYKKIATLFIVVFMLSFGFLSLVKAQEQGGSIDIGSKDIISKNLVESLKDDEQKTSYLISIQKTENNADNPEIFEQMKENNLKLIDYVSSQLESKPDNIKIDSKMESIGVISIMADKSGLEFIKTVKGVSSIQKNKLQSPALYQSIPRIGGSVNSGFPATQTALGNQYTGKNRTVAIIDSNFSNTNPMLSNKIVKSYCTGTNETYVDVALGSACQGGETSLGEGCLVSIQGCGHGILVSSVAAGKKTTATIEGDGVSSPDLYPSPGKQESYTVSGVAKDANIYGMSSGSIISEIPGQNDVCGDPSIGNEKCLRFPDTDVLNSMNKLISDINSGSINNVDSVNLSLGGGNDYHSTRETCDNGSNNDVYNTIYPALKAKGVAVVRAAGNEGGESANANKVDSSSCGEGSVVVGASYTNKDKMASYSNASELILDLVAPGGDTPSPPTLAAAWDDLLVGAAQQGGDNYLITKKNADYSHHFGGTSSAAPHVSGAFAVLREQHPNITVDRALKLLKDTADPITDDRAGYTGNVYKRLNLGKAVSESDVFPEITSLEFDKASARSGDNVTLTINSTNANKCSINNTIGEVPVTSDQAVKTFPVTNASYSVTCESEYGDVSASRTVDITLVSAPLVIAPPTNLVVDNITTTSAVVNFTNSITSTVNAYEGWLDGVKLATGSAIDNRINLSGLQSGKEHTVDIYAVDASGSKSVSAQVKFSTLVQAVNPPTDTVINPVVSRQIDNIVKNDSSISDNPGINVPKTGKAGAIALTVSILVSVALVMVIVIQKNKSNKSAER